MNIYLTLTLLAYQPQTWVILGIAFLLLEMTDGSKIFFLPLGVSAQIIALIVYLVNESILPHSLIPAAWYWLIVYWICIAILATLLLVQLRKYKKANAPEEPDDINNY